MHVVHLKTDVREQLPLRLHDELIGVRRFSRLLDPKVRRGLRREVDAVSRRVEPERIRGRRRRDNRAEVSRQLGVVAAVVTFDDRFVRRLDADTEAR